MDKQQYLKAINDYAATMPTPRMAQIVRQKGTQLVNSGAAWMDVAEQLQQTAQLAHGQELSREKMFAARRAQDFAAENASRQANLGRQGPSMTQGEAGNTMAERQKDLKSALERGIVYGTGFGGMAMTGMPAMSIARQAMVGTPFSMMSSESPEVDALIGAAMIGGKKLLVPAAVAAGTAYAADANAVPKFAVGGQIKGALARLAARDKTPAGSPITRGYAQGGLVDMYDLHGYN